MSAAARWKKAGALATPATAMSLTSAVAALNSGVIVAKRDCEKCGKGLMTYTPNHPQFDELGGWSDPDWACDICEQEYRLRSIAALDPQRPRPMLHMIWL
jgi:hypothetical protein